MKKEGIVETVRALALPVTERFGLTLWDVEYVKEGSEWYLRIVIDKPEGVTIEDCEAVHLAIDPLLDEADPIEDSYHLEVSSPGLERTLTSPFHFEACRGEEVELRLYAPLDGSKSYVGELLGLTDENKIALKLPDGSEKAFEREKVSSVKTRVSFDEI
ncbi:MAG: ribosome maturation factor RimP [Clostridia bacterium]|nr:ribosome maturation factor RimP [Clostridia bacterium]